MHFSQYFLFWHPGNLLLYTLLLACGITLQWWCQIPYAVLMAVAGGLIVSQVVYYSYKKTWLPYSLYILALCAGHCVYQKQFDDHQILFVLAQEKPITII